tara:strand:+ start:179 stop:1045 length:867 start_codon:yes stop_codon:yes gene_type:complete
MIKSCNDIWAEISVVNNAKWEFLFLGKNNDIPILVAKDYFKFPDKVNEFISNGHWWTNGCNNFEAIVRPGKSYYVYPEIVDWFCDPLINSIRPLFGVNQIGIKSINGNCFNGDMLINDPRSVFPHTDLADIDGNIHIEQSAHVACNINLTKSNNVKTGFWSFKGKKSWMDFSHNDRNEEAKFFESLRKSLPDNAKWFQIDDYDQYKLEEIVEMSYNSFVAYPTCFLHNPYIKEDWFNDSDRITIAGFFDILPKDLEFEQNDLGDVSYAWEFFHLDKVHNFHPKDTVLK